PEAQAVVDFVRDEMFEADAALSLDVHSGFGAIDRLWYPYAKQRFGFPRAGEARRLGELLTRTYPNHVYRIEPQSHAYTTHGDLWDYIFDAHPGHNFYLPWTLEMGSWAWVRKNPSQMLSRSGLFHPQKPHRHRRILRRHLVLFDFLWRAIDNYAAWIS